MIDRTPRDDSDSPSHVIGAGTVPHRAAESAVLHPTDPEPSRGGGGLAVIDVEPEQDEDFDEDGTPLAKTELWKRKKGQALNSTDLRLMLALYQEGRSQQEIAHRLNCTQACISRNLKIWADTTVEAKAVVRRSAKKLAEKLVKEADADQILEIFDREDVLTKKRNTDEGSSRVQVLIGVQMPKGVA